MKTQIDSDLNALLHRRLDEYIGEFEAVRDAAEKKLPVVSGAEGNETHGRRCKINELCMTVAVLSVLKKLKRGAPAEQASFWLRDVTDSIREIYSLN